MTTRLGNQRLLRQVVLLVLAVACATGAVIVSRVDGIDSVPLLDSWRGKHPDVRTLSPAERDAFDGLLAPARRDDLLFLLVGLAAGCTLLLWNERWARTGPAGTSTATGHGAEDARADRGWGPLFVSVMVWGALALGVWRVAASVSDQREAAVRARWTLSDDALHVVAGPLEDTLRAWRDTVPEDEAVILVGTNQFLWNITAWVLYPRPIYPLLHEVPPGLDRAAMLDLARQLPHGAEHPGRWIVDLAALEGGDDAQTRGPLRVDE